MVRVLPRPPDRLPACVTAHCTVPALFSAAQTFPAWLMPACTSSVVLPPGVAVITQFWPTVPPDAALKATVTQRLSETGLVLRPLPVLVNVVQVGSVPHSNRADAVTWTQYCVITFEPIAPVVV